MESEIDDEDPEYVFVDESISVPALAAAAGMNHPFLDPSMLDAGDKKLVFHRGRSGAGGG